MDKRFDPASYESRWQRTWSERGYFRCEVPSSKPSFCIMIPPPNVTGKLHMGHALQSTLQDLLTRWKRMQGFNALWLPGTDHAGIATQLMVERALAAEGTDRHELGRERFLARMWEWKETHHGNIRRQLDQLGASCDWSRERFTLDEGLSRAVREAFVRLHREGLISRGEYLVNWSPALDTAISDLEVEMKSVQDSLWQIAYPVEGSDERVVVATTRPETMLGDTAIAFHPDDERYRHLLGRRAIVPVAGRAIPFVADPVVEREFGTGLVKVTPCHDPADFELGRRHGLPGIAVIDRRGRMTPAAGAAFAGLPAEEAREKLLVELRAAGLLLREEPYVHNVGHCQRSGVRIQPLVSTQWFCDVSGMARQALDAVRERRIELLPSSWEKTWEHWLDNIRPWCISRQLWWGHQIPAWYDPEGTAWVAHSREEAEALAGTRDLRQDEDVLDTWFSSALWPFSTLGWPEETEDLKAFYPTDVLVTAFDILFFWVARMAMAGLHFTGEVPFRQVHLTGLVRDASGVKMSKTKGNVLDPAELVAEYGADAVRFTLALLDAPGRDIPLDPERMAGYRAFGNKIWNATRFVLGRVGDARVDPALDPADLALPERWILSRLAGVAAEVGEKLEVFRFDEACQRLYHFFWGDLCDWYIELSKPALSGEAPRPRVAEVLLTVLERALRLLHPVMPFLTEELWQRLPGRKAIHAETICLAPYPGPEPAWVDPVSESRMAALVDVVTRARALRVDLGLRPKERARLLLEGGDEQTVAFLAGQEALLGALAQLAAVAVGEAGSGAVRDRVAGVAIALEAEAREASPAELGRLAAELERLDAELARARARLADPSFLAKAPPQVVDGNRRRVEELEERRARLRAGLGAS
ncbi:MAG: valine--tRNA ligase [Thermoanaerobaculia bacterium]|nr:valine--tRNA ligase [Thermoanaerobaculia bacterium]MCZ7650884.1 valine--tRNA ligase [Thermoanaerobaculia bacterium]